METTNQVVSMNVCNEVYIWQETDIFMIMK